MCRWPNARSAAACRRAVEPELIRELRSGTELVGPEGESLGTVLKMEPIGAQGGESFRCTVESYAMKTDEGLRISDHVALNPGNKLFLTFGEKVFEVTVLVVSSD